MNKIKTLITILFFSLAYSSLSVVGQTDANELLIKMDETVFAAKDKTSSIEMVMINQKSGKEKIFICDKPGIAYKYRVRLLLKGQHYIDTK